MLNTATISALTDNGVKSNRQWVPNQLYTGYVQSIDVDGSVAVQINNKVYQALAHKSAQPGDKLSLRLLGIEPAPHFAIVGVLQRASQIARMEESVQVQTAWQGAANLLRKLDPGIATLVGLWQRYPEELARLSPQLPALLTALGARALAADDLLKPGRLKAHALHSGTFFEAEAATENPDEDLKPLLFRLLAALGNKRQLTLESGRPVFENKGGSAAQNLHDRTAALYATEQETDSGAKTLRQLLSLNVENALLQLVSGQMSSLSRSDGNFSLWIMQLMIKYQDLTIPVELEFRKNLQAQAEHWEAVFSVELPQSGRIYAELLVKNLAVSVRLVSNQAGLVELWNSQRSGLRRMLDGLGLDLQDFQCQQVEAA